MVRRLICLPYLFLTLAVAVTAARAQGPPTQSQSAAPVFDVAAIHVHEPQPHEHNSIWSSPFDGNFNTENISAISLIEWAYAIPDTRILGAPDWARSTMFNIEGKGGPSVDQQLRNLTSDAGRKQKEKMVQALLADRFHLAMHSETRELPIYNLMVAKGGSKLGAVQQSGSSVNTGNGRIEVQMSNSVAVLADELSKVAGRDVVDKTGISGRYDLKLHWTPDDRSAVAATDATSSPDSGPSLFTALEEQLGLKLEPAKVPVQVLVIDHIELPSEN
jgi:uncharacterized protein (TIGR03435 family)